MENSTEENKKSGNDEPLLFEITSAHISEATEVEKKHVIYTLQVRHISGTREDTVPSTVDRRYTNFYNLYNALRTEEPELMSTIAFPRKVLTGNFDNKLISTRSTGFESLLKHISIESKLRTSPSLLNFLQDVELEKAKKYIEEKQFFFAVPLLENNFRLLNKVYTDRSPAVLLALCRLLGCCISLPGSPNALKWADLALHRYEGVSDSDLLELYVPLLQVCIKLWRQHERDTKTIEERLSDLKRQGCKVDENLSLLDAVNKVEEKIFPLNTIATT